MRIRTIKPEFWRSDDITALNREDRLLFIGLWSYVDDNGVGIDDYRRIAADLFAFEDDQKEIRDYVREGLATLSRGLLILRYEIEKHSLLFIPTWDLHQRVDRPGKERYPRPPSDFTSSTSGNPYDVPLFDVASRESRDGLAPRARSWNRGTGEQGNRGTGKTRASRSRIVPEGFEEWYRVYPLHKARGAAEDAYRKAVESGADPELLRESAERYAKTAKNGYTKHPSTWLNQKCWLDEDAPADNRNGQYWQDA